MSKQSGTTDRFNFKCPPPLPGKQTEDVDIADVCAALYDVITWLNGIRDVLCACDHETININPAEDPGSIDYTDVLVPDANNKKKKKKKKKTDQRASAAAKKKTSRKSSKKGRAKKSTRKSSSRKSSQ